VPNIALTVFTKPWFDPLEKLADKVAELGLDGIELPVRPGYQVEPQNVATALPAAVRIMKRRGLQIRSVAAPLDAATIAACGEAGVPILRTMVGIDLSKAGYAETIAQHRRLWDSLIPALDTAKVTIGIQNHSGNCIGSAIGVFHLLEKYDPRHVCAILDMAHSCVAGEPRELAVDLLWDRMRGLVNFKSAFRERVNGPEEVEAVYRTHWTTAPHSGYSWGGLVEELLKRGFEGTFCLPAEYTDPAGQPQRMGDDVLPFLRQDIAYLKGLLASAAAR
jgi:sugar phosphate isomerase/epimerase